MYSSLQWCIRCACWRFHCHTNLITRRGSKVSGGSQREVAIFDELRRTCWFISLK
jgi:hypothetical protein